MDDAILFDGVSLYNRKQFFDCHDVWEELWMELRGEQKLFVQGLIQIAVAYYHSGNGNFRGGSNLFAKGLDKLSHFPDQYLRLDISELRRMARIHAAQVDGHPQHHPCPFSDNDIPTILILESSLPNI